MSPSSDGLWVSDVLFPALEREELLPLPLLLDSGQRCLDPPPDTPPPSTPPLSTPTATSGLP